MVNGVSGNSHHAQIQGGPEKQNNANVEAAVTKKSLDAQKAQGQRVVDMIEKAGSSLDVFA